MYGRMLSVIAALIFVSSSAGAMQLSSPNVATGASLSLDQVKNNCGGRNISPALSWSDVPSAAKSFAITVFDPDAQGGWWHWIVVNIPATVQSLPAGAGNGTGLPKGAAQAENDFGDAAYGGACPPPGSGQHHYQFTVWALPDPSLPSDSTAKTETVVAYLKSHALGHADLVGIYER